MNEDDTYAVLTTGATLAQWKDLLQKVEYETREASIKDVLWIKQFREGSVAKCNEAIKLLTEKKDE